jgi:outer membrane protein assembly factor BamB
MEMPAEYQRLFQCNFCGTTLEDLSPPEKQKPDQKPKVVVHTVKVAPTPVTQHEESSGCSGWVVFLLIVGFIGAMIIIPLWWSGELQFGGSLFEGLNRIRIYSFGLTRLLPSDNDSEPDVVGVTYNADETRRMVYVDFDADKHLRWQSEPLADEAGYVYNHLVADHAAVYMAYETTLIAFDRQDGSILWQTELSDQVANYCEDCLLTFGDWVLALSDDGVLSGINAQTGEPAWNVRLNETPRQLLNLNGSAGVLDEENDETGINVYAPDTGSLIQRIVPQCPNDVFSDSPRTLHIYDSILVTRDGQGIYLPISGYDHGCLQKLNPATLAIDWETQVPNDILDAMNWNAYLLTDNALYTSEQEGLYAVSLTDGSYQTLLSDDDHDLTPLAEQNGTLITLAERTRGTRRFLLWGIDIEGQSLSWQFEPQAESFHSEGSDVADTDGLWGVGADRDIPIIWQAFSEPGTITFTVLDPLDGSTMAENLFEVNKNDYSYWMQVPGWQGEYVYLEMDARLWLLDALSGTEIAIWP